VASPPGAERLVRSPAAPAVKQVDASYLESLIGYGTRRAALAMIDVIMPRMVDYVLRPSDLSVLSLITHNPGITSRQLCATLCIFPPNLVGLVNRLEKRKLIVRRPHPRDGRAVGLYLTAMGHKFTHDAEQTVAELEAEVACRLSAMEARTLIRLLKKIYLVKGSFMPRTAAGQCTYEWCGVI
jgi:DNA-binding MarR family transcriptional regulator